MAKIAYGDVPRYWHLRTSNQSPAIIYPSGHLTWSSLEDRSNQRAHQLLGAGTRRGDIVTIALANSLDVHELAFATWKIGAVPNMVSSKLPDHELRSIIELVRPRVIFSAEALDIPGVDCVSPSFDISRLSTKALTAEPFKYWKAMTSGGSTGRPKVIVDHGAAEFDLDSPTTLQRFGMRSGMVVLNPGPLYHNAPFLFSHLALFGGGTLVGMDRFDAEEVLRLIQHYRVSWVNLVPTMMHRIWALPSATREKYDLSSLSYVWHMASSCPSWLKQFWIDWLGPEKIWELYGGSEGIGRTVIGGREWLRKKGSVGRASDPSALRILEVETGEVLGSAEIGEIYFRLQGAPPYHYVGATSRRTEDGWESLGDMGWLDDDGYLFIADRRTDLIVRGGANIYPAEVEGVLESHASVSSAVVVGLPSDEYGQEVHAIVETRVGDADLTNLHEFVAARLSKYKRPSSYELASQPLRDDAGKVRRSALRQERIEWLNCRKKFRFRIDEVKGAS